MKTRIGERDHEEMLSCKLHQFPPLQKAQGWGNLSFDSSINSDVFLRFPWQYRNRSSLARYAGARAVSACGDFVRGAGVGKIYAGTDAGAGAELSGADG